MILANFANLTKKVADLMKQRLGNLPTCFGKNLGCARGRTHTRAREKVAEVGEYLQADERKALFFGNLISEVGQEVGR